MKISKENAVKEAAAICENFGVKFDEVKYESLIELISAGRIRHDSEAVYFKLVRPITYGAMTISELRVADPIRAAFTSANVRLSDIDKPEVQDKWLAIYCGQPVEVIGQITNSDANKIAASIIPIFM